MNKSIINRFFAKVDKTDNCWEWTACKNTDGYGGFRYLGKWDRAHRVSWMIHSGEIPDKLFVLHTCDNPSCVNPAHLFLGNNSTNMLDMYKKGRGLMRDSELAPTAKLTFEIAEQIRIEYKTVKSQRALARTYGVCQRSIAKIVNNLSYTHNPVLPFKFE